MPSKVYIGTLASVRPHLALPEDTEWHEMFALDAERVRTIMASAALSPRVGERRAIVLAFRQFMSTAAQNALLKTLEEPPAHTELVLIVPSLHILIPTVRSRLLYAGTYPAAPSREVCEFQKLSYAERLKKIGTFLDEAKEAHDADKKERQKKQRDIPHAADMQTDTRVILEEILEMLEREAYEAQDTNRLKRLVTARGLLAQPSAPKKMILEYVL